MIALLLLLIACKVTHEPAVPAPSTDPAAEYGDLLARVVGEDGGVDYERLAAHRGPLDRYVAQVAEGRVARGMRSRFAWWINAHNALALFAVLEEGRPASVRDVPAPFPWPGPPEAAFFQQRQFVVGLDRLSLWEIVDERLRMMKQDVRLHGAITRVSRSSPPMRAELYTGRRLDFQLHDQMARWVNDPERGVRLEGGVAVVNPLFEMYGRDFELWTAGDDLCTTLAPYARPRLRAGLEALAERGCPLRTFPYDWSLDHEEVPERDVRPSRPAEDPEEAPDTGAPAGF